MSVDAASSAQGPVEHFMSRLITAPLSAQEDDQDRTVASKLIMVVAFDPDEHGNLQPIFAATEAANEECAIRTATALSTKYADVVAWSRQVDATGAYGSPRILFRTPVSSGDPTGPS